MTRILRLFALLTPFIFLAGCVGNTAVNLQYGTPAYAHAFEKPINMAYLHQGPPADRTVALTVNADTQGGPAIGESLRERYAAGLQAAGFTVVPASSPHAIDVRIDVNIFGHFVKTEASIAAGNRVVTSNVLNAFQTSDGNVQVFGLDTQVMIAVKGRPSVQIQYGSKVTGKNIRFEDHQNTIVVNAVNDLVHVFGG